MSFWIFFRLDIKNKIQNQNWRENARSDTNTGHITPGKGREALFPSHILPLHLWLKVLRCTQLGAIPRGLLLRWPQYKLHLVTILTNILFLHPSKSSIQKSTCIIHRLKLKKMGKTIRPFISVQSLSRVRPFVTPWITAHQVSLSIANS